MRLPSKDVQARVQTVYQDRSGTVWIGTDGQGAFAIAKGRVMSFTTRDGLRSDFIRAFCEDGQGQLWIGTSSGLSRRDGHGFKGNYTNDGLVYFSVRSLARDSRGDIWIGTEKGISRMRDGKFLPGPDAMRHEKILSIADDNEGAEWLGTDNSGLVRVKGDFQSVTLLRNALPSKTVYQVIK